MPHHPCFRHCPSGQALGLAGPALGAVLALLGGTVAGCAGGSGGGAQPSSPAALHSVQAYGPVVTRVVGAAQPPVVLSGYGSVVTGIAGGLIDSVFERIDAPQATITTQNVPSRLAFASRTTGQYQIYVSDPNNFSKFNRITDGAAANHLPSWSPDGQRIVFASERDGNSEIYTMNADGTNVQRLTNNPAKDTEPTWSPDGKQIAFVSNRSGNNDVYTMSVDGTSVANRTNDPADDISPAWSPDSETIGFSSNRGGQYDIYTMLRDGRQVKNVTNTPPANEYEPVFSTGNTFSGYTIIYIRKEGGSGTYRNVWQIGTDGTAPAASITGNAVTGVDYFRPTVIPYQNNYYYNSPLYYLSNWNGRSYALYRSNYYTTANVGYDYRVVLDQVDSVALSNYSSVTTTTPAPADRVFVGAKGILAPECAGFLFGMTRVTSGNYYNQQTQVRVSSMVVADTEADKRTQMRIDPLPPSSTNPNYATGNSFLFCSLTAGDALITSLKYVNTSTGTVKTIIGDTGGPATAGALVYFDPTFGSVDAILPYSANRSRVASASDASVTREGETLVLRGHFAAAWDRTGANRAPAGATEVRVNARTGAITDAR
jgi:Tol biopolymer transport system component